MKKLTTVLALLLFSSQLYASPVATFSTDTVSSDTVDIEISSLPEDTQRELATIKSMHEVIVSSAVELYSTKIYKPSMSITQAEYNTLYAQRLALHNNGTNPLPVRYLPVDYDNGMTVADANGLDRTVMYEVVLGYPIFYKIDRYNRPNSYTELQGLPNTNSDKLDTSQSGFTSKIGTLYLN